MPDTVVGSLAFSRAVVLCVLFRFWGEEPNNGGSGALLTLLFVHWHCVEFLWGIHGFSQESACPRDDCDRRRQVYSKCE